MGQCFDNWAAFERTFARAALDQIVQGKLDFLKPYNLSLYLVQFHRGALANIGAIGFRITPEIEKTADFTKRETESLRLFYKANLRDDPHGIMPERSLRTRGTLNQTLALIKADGFEGNASLPSGLSDGELMHFVPSIQAVGSRAI